MIAIAILSSAQKDQKASQLKGLFAAQGLHAANQPKLGLETFAAILRTLAPALQKFPMPCHYAQGHHRFA